MYVGDDSNAVTVDLALEAEKRESLRRRPAFAPMSQRTRRSARGSRPFSIVTEGDLNRWSWPKHAQSFRAIQPADDATTALIHASVRSRPELISSGSASDAFPRWTTYVADFDREWLGAATDATIWIINDAASVAEAELSSDATGGTNSYRSWWEDEAPVYTSIDRRHALGPKASLANVQDTFRRWFAARTDAVRESEGERLAQVADPHLILGAAFSEFREKGNAHRLVAAADLLERRGAASLPSLQQLILSGASEGEYFVEAIMHIAHNPLLTDRAARILDACAQHPERNVRYRVADNADALPAAIRTALLARLAADSDDRVSEAAICALDRRS